MQKEKRPAQTASKACSCLKTLLWMVADGWTVNAPSKDTSSSYNTVRSATQRPGTVNREQWSVYKWAASVIKVFFFSNEDPENAQINLCVVLNKLHTFHQPLTYPQNVLFMHIQAVMSVGVRFLLVPNFSHPWQGRAAGIEMTAHLYSVRTHFLISHEESIISGIHF